MNNGKLEVAVDLINHKIQFAGVLRENAPVTIDYTPPLGDGQGYMPLELLLMSLAACSGATVATLLRGMGNSVSGLQVKATGSRREQHPTSFERISLEFVLNSPDAKGPDIQKAITLSEETYCPVWAMLKDSAEITAEYTLIDPS